ncbi:MAG TPA: hypothetical protein G4N92_07735 [Anaerolineae bacterium]|nr:hypothetical protein [Anaerolineae bacterium]
MKGKKRNKNQFVFIFLIVIFFFMLIGLNSRLSEYFRLSMYQDQMETKVYSLQSTEIALKTQIAFATSDYAVEAWARSEGHLALPGDNVIIPLPLDIQTPQYLSTPTAFLSQAEKWRVWWELFFGE